MTDWKIDKEQTTKYLADLVRINSINPTLSPGGAGEMDIAGWLMETCTELGLNVVMQYGKHDRPNVIASWSGKGGGGSILLTGHMDTVGVENMEIPPFEPRIEDGRLYGRGSYDMKGGIASILGAVKALKEGGFQPKGRIILGFVADEEYASFGTEKMVKELKVDAAILTEPTETTICIAHRGFAWLKIKTRGLAAHGSLFYEGIDAVAHMGRVLGALESMDAETLSKRSHPLLKRPSVHASLIKGGLGLSTYPDEATLEIEHRMLPDEKGAHMLALWQGALGKLSSDDPSFAAEVSLTFERPGYEISPDAPIVETLCGAFNEVTGKNPEFTGQLAWLDAALLGAADIPTVIIGPGGAGAHAAVEYVELNQVYQCAEIIAEAVSRWTMMPRMITTPETRSTH